FPFTRRADLGETAILMPALPSPRTLSSLLSVSAHLAHVAGANASRAEFISDAKAPLDRDLIVVGTPAEQPVLARWHLLRQLAPLRSGRSDVGIVSTFESPLRRGRTALLVTATRDTGLPELTKMGSLVSTDRNDLAVVAGNDLRLFRSDDGYVV